MSTDTNETAAHITELFTQVDQHFRALIEHSSDAVALVDAAGTFLYISPSIQKFLGYSAQELLGHSGFELVPAEQLAFTNAEFHKALASPGIPVTIEHQYTHKNGSIRWLESIVTNLLHDPEVGAIVSNFHDVTERKQAEEERSLLLGREQAARAEAEAAHRRLHDLFMQAPAIICLFRGPEHVYEMANPVYYQAVGKRDLIGKPIREALPELEGQGIVELLDQVYSTGKTAEGNETLVWLDRQRTGMLEACYFNFIFQATRDHQGTIDGIQVYGVEITEQVRARQKIQQSEARLRRLVDSNLIGIVFCDLDGNIHEANDVFLHTTGYTREDLQAGRVNWLGMTPAEYLPLDEQAVQEMQESGSVSKPYEKVYIRKDGHPVHVLVAGALLQMEQRECVAFVLDIDRQKQMEVELKRAKEQLETIFHTAQDGITVRDASGTLIYANDAAAKLSNFPSGEAMMAGWSSVVDRTFAGFELYDEAGNPFQHENLPGRRALRGEQHVQAVVQYRNRHSGISRWSLIKAQPIFDDQGKVQLAVSVITDITERQELEQRKNDFISMASHELKTPVTSLKGFTNVLQRRLSKAADQQGLQYLSRMDGQLNKLTKLISELLDISKMQSGKLAFSNEPFDLAVLIRETVDNLQGITPDHQLSIEEAAHAQVIGDRDRIGQVLINLLNNAIKYSPNAQRVVIALTTDGTNAHVRVQDFGIGIDEAHQQKIFERFYQVTDPEEKTYPGLGIGLYICNEIVKRHHGQIWVESQKGKGATFHFTLPLHREQ